MDIYASYSMPNRCNSKYMHSYTEGNKPHDVSATLAIARVVMQPKIAQVYNTNTALMRGTLFPELDKPFKGRRGAY